MRSVTLRRRTASVSSETLTLVAVLALAAVLLFAGMGLRSPWPPDEPRFAYLAHEMLSTGQWLFPARGGELYPDKPPLFMWAIATGLKVTGNLNIAMLLPSAIASLITLAAVFDIGRRLWDGAVGRNAALLLLFTPQFLIQAKFAQIDALLTCWTTLACYGLLRHFLCGPAWRWYFAAWFFMGLGIITKGVGFLPIFLLPLLGACHYATSHGKNTWTRRTWLGPLVLLAAVALWLGPMLWQVARHPDPELIAYRDNILFRQTGERYTNPWGHIKPWYYLWLNVIPALWAPGSLLLLTGFRTIIQRSMLDRRILVLFIWVIAVVTFFSFSPGKRGVYVLPALPIFCLALSAVWRVHPPSLAGRTALRLLVGGVTVLAGIAATLALTHHPVLMRHLQVLAQPEQTATWVAVIAASTCAVLVGCQWFTRRVSPWIAYGATVTILVLVQSLAVNPLLEPLRTPASLMQSAVARVNGGELAIIDSKEHYLLFSPIPLVHFGYFSSDATQYRNAWQWINEREGRYVMAPERGEIECFDPALAQAVGYAHRQNWVLYSRESAQPRCATPEVLRRFRSVRGPYGKSRQRSLSD